MSNIKHNLETEIFFCRLRQFAERTIVILLLAERETAFAERTTLLGERSKSESFSKYLNFSPPFMDQKANAPVMLLKCRE